MSDNSTTNYWAEIDGGFRGSLMMRLGAVAVAGAGLVDLGARLLAETNGPSDGITRIAWLLYIVGLWLVAAGFIWVGSQPIMTRFGFVVGAFHAVQGVHVLVMLFTFAAVRIPPISLTIGRLLATLFFAFMEKEWLNRRTRYFLAIASGLMLMKAISRLLGFLTALGSPLEPLLDTVLLLGVSASLLHLATVIRLEEDDWAQTIYETGHADLADFNNPEHSWNKTEDKEVENHRS